MVDVVVVGNIDRYSLVFTREMVDVVVVGNIDRYSLVISLMKIKG
jgi:hypothetical protein